MPVNPTTRKRVYKDGKVVNGNQIDSRGQILGVNGKMSDSTDLPEWATNRAHTEQYQKWVNEQAAKRGEKPPINDWGKTDYGRGRFGPQTAQALKKYGSDGFKPGDTPNSSAPTKNTSFKFEKGETVPIDLNVKQLGPVDRNLSGDVSRVTKDNIPTAKTSTKSNVFDKAGSIVPYLSNVTAMFTNASRPDAPGYINPIGARRVNYDDQRVEADRMTRGANMNASASLDENTAAGVRAVNTAGGLRAKNGINAAETNKNAEIGLQVDGMNANIEAQNVGMKNHWSEQLTEANNADKMNHQYAIANASDKFISQQEQKDKMTLDRERLSVYKHMFKTSGVMDRTIGSYNENNAAMGLPEDKIVNGNRTNTAIGSNKPLSTIPGRIKSVFAPTATSTFEPAQTVSTTVGNFQNEPVDRQLTGRVSGFKVRNAFGGYIRYAAGGRVG